MKLTVLGSSSAGNGYVLSSVGGSLLIEAGVPLLQVEAAVNYKLADIKGCVISHEHADHAKYVKEYLQAGIRVLALKTVFDRYGQAGNFFSKEIRPMCGYRVGGFLVTALPAVHDVPCLAFVIWHQDMGSLAFLTDTMMLEYKLPPVEHLMVEANYSDASLMRNIENGVAAASERDRLMHAHMSVETAIGVAKACDSKMLRDITLIHLSVRNADEAAFVETMQKATGKPVYVAHAGASMTLKGSEK